MIEPKDLSFPELKKFWRHAKEQAALHKEPMQIWKFQVIAKICEEDAAIRWLILN